METSADLNSKPSGKNSNPEPQTRGFVNELSPERPPLNLRTFAAAYQLRRNSPELLNRVPPELRTRLQQGEPSVLSDLLRTQPELFRNELLGRLEDEAFSQLLAGQEPSQQQPSETSPEPSLA